MPQYVLLIYNQPEADQRRRDAATGAGEGSDALTKEQFQQEQQRWGAFYQELQEAGALVDNKGLQSPEAATTVRVRDGETQITDGPFAETKEILASYFVIEAEDLDTALRFAAKVPSAEYGSVEVRPVWG